jgi:hypothetical protein
MAILRPAQQIEFDTNKEILRKFLSDNANLLVERAVRFADVDDRSLDESESRKLKFHSIGFDRRMMKPRPISGEGRFLLAKHKVSLGFTQFPILAAEPEEDADPRDRWLYDQMECWEETEADSNVSREGNYYFCIAYSYMDGGHQTYDIRILRADGYHVRYDIEDDRRVWKADDPSLVAKLRIGKLDFSDEAKERLDPETGTFHTPDKAMEEHSTTLERFECVEPDDTYPKRAFVQIENVLTEISTLKLSISE